MSLDKFQITEFAGHDEWLHIATGTLLHRVKVGATAGRLVCVRPGVCSLAMLSLMPALTAVPGASALVEVGATLEQPGKFRLFTTDGSAFAASVDSERCVLADLPDAEPGNDGRFYFVTDENGGTLRRSNGSAMEKIAASVNATGGGGGTDPGAGDGGIVSTTWAERGVGAEVGEVKRVTDLGNLGTVEIIWDGVRWQPRGGMQVIYTLREPLSGPNATNSTVQFPDVTVPADLLGIYGGLALEWMAEVPGTPTGRVVQVAFGGTAICNDSTNATVRTVFYARHLRNIGSASSQLVSQAGQEHTGAYMGQVNRSPLRLAIDTAAPVVITGGVAFTSAAAQAASLGVYRVTWVTG